MRWDTFLAVEFWALVTMATMGATALSALLNWVSRWRSRPLVEWAVVPGKGYNSPREEGGPYILSANALNVGDGFAFRVVARGVHCVAAFQGELVRSPWGDRRFDVPIVPIVEPGQECPMEIRCSLANWNQAEITIEWTQSPTRRRRRYREVVPLREIRPAPEPDGA